MFVRQGYNCKVPFEVNTQTCQSRVDNGSTKGRFLPNNKIPCELSIKITNFKALLNWKGGYFLITSKINKIKSRCGLSEHAQKHHADLRINNRHLNLKFSRCKNKFRQTFKTSAIIVCFLMTNTNYLEIRVLFCIFRPW